MRAIWVLQGRISWGGLFIGGSRFTTGLAECLTKAGAPVLIADPNHGYLSRARAAGIKTFYGDILPEAAEHQVELLSYRTLVAATDNDAYNTLVATDFGPEFGRDNCWQIARAKAGKSRHALPTRLGGRPFGEGRGFDGFEHLLADGWAFRMTKLTEEFTQAQWREKRPDAVLVGTLDAAGAFRLTTGEDDPDLGPGVRLIALLPPEASGQGA